jgi:hypothetical protein
MANICLDLNEKTFDSNRKNFEKEALKEGNKNSLRISNVTFNIDTFEFNGEDDLLVIAGDATIIEDDENKEFGFVSVAVELPSAIAQDIIEAYIKKLNKMKAVLEGLK